jgi:hypothetical protein
MITRKNINKYFELTKAVTDAEDFASELLRTAQDRNKHRTHKIEREGKEITVTEKVLWDEVFYLGVGSQAGKFMMTLYPDLFEAYRKQDQAAAELKKFGVLELGLDHSKMKVSDFIKLTEGLLDLLLVERGYSVKSPIQK